MAKQPEPELLLSEWERDVLKSAAMIQVDRHLAPAFGGPVDREKADRWREIADAIRDGKTVGFRPPKRRGDDGDVD